MPNPDDSTLEARAFPTPEREIDIPGSRLRHWVKVFADGTASVSYHLIGGEVQRSNDSRWGQQNPPVPVGHLGEVSFTPRPFEGLVSSEELEAAARYIENFPAA